MKRNDINYMAYLAVHSLAVASCWTTLFFKIYKVAKETKKGKNKYIGEKIDKGMYEHRRWKRMREKKKWKT